MEPCRLCGERKKFIKAHAIPEAFFRVLRGDDREPPLLVAGGEFPKRAPIGVYDQGILCADCEPLFADLDTYAAQMLLQDFSCLFAPIARGGRAVAYDAPTVDGGKLLRFLVATLWRASVSRHPFYERIDLGRHEAAAARFALGGEDDGGVFDALLARWTSAAEVDFRAHGMMDPFRHKYDGVNAYRLYLGDMMAEVKVDQRPFPRRLASFGLRRAPPVRVVVRDFARSKELPAMRRTALLAKGERS